MPNPFGMEGNWYKGNLHTHTNNSDGELSIEEVLDGYKKHNYDFLAITDHNKVTEVEGYSRKDFLVLPGIEIEVDKSSLETPYHLVGINIKKEIEIPPDPKVRQQIKVQKGINLLKENGCMVILAHPYWSGLTMEELFSLEGPLGIEVYNSTCLRGIGKGLSSIPITTCHLIVFY